jgi:hypothetical protein
MTAFVVIRAWNVYRVTRHAAQPERPQPDREVPSPAVPPDMEPVVPQQDPPLPGRPGDGEPPPVVALLRHSSAALESVYGSR